MPAERCEAEQHPEPAADEVAGDQRGDEDGRQPDVELLLAVQALSTTARRSSGCQCTRGSALLACAPVPAPNTRHFQGRRRQTPGGAWIRCWRRACRGCRGGRRACCWTSAACSSTAGGSKIAGKADVRRRGGRRGAWGARWRARPRRPGAAARGEDERQLPAFAVVFEDDDIVVVDKPSGLLTAPTPESDRNNLADLLARRPGRRRRCSSSTGSISRPAGWSCSRRRADANRELSKPVPRPRSGARRTWRWWRARFPTT